MELQELYRRVGVIRFLKNDCSVNFPVKLPDSGYVLLNSPIRNDDEHASFSINIEHGGWNDFATGDKGDFAELVARLKGLQKKDAISLLKKNIGIEETVKKQSLPKKYIDKDVYERYIERLHNEQNSYAQNLLLYFYTRKQIHPDVLRKAKVGLSDKNTVIYPYHFHEDGHVIAWKEIRYNLDENFQAKKDFITNSPATIFPDYVVRQHPAIVVLCAGENDALALNSLHHHNRFPFPAVCFTSGENSFPKNVDYWFKNKSVTILYDYDEAGKKGALKVAHHFASLTHSLYIANWENDQYVRLLKSSNQSIKGFDVCDYLSQRGINEQTVSDLYLFLLKADKYRPVEHVHNPTCHFFTPDFWRDLRKSADGQEVMKMRNDKVQIVQSKAAQLIVKHCKVAYYNANAKRTFMRFDDESKIWSETPDEMIGNAVFHLLGEHYTARYSREIVHAVKEYYSLGNVRFNSYTDLINLSNTAFDLHHFLPVKPEKEHYHNYRNDYEYQPFAKCPAFDDFLKTISLNDEEWITAFWEIAGYCLTHHYTYQKMFWFHGQGGRNGKGTVMRIMQKLTGAFLTKPDISPEKLSGNFFLQNLLNKRLATCGDMPGFWMNIDVVKKLTGGDTISSAVKFANSEIEFHNTAKLVFAMNDMPVLSANESLDPIKKRIVLLPFEYSIREEDSSIERAFLRELPGIFNKAIDGLKRLHYNKSFTPVTRSKELLDKWSVNPVYQFFERHIQLSNAENAELEMVDVWELYMSWMNKNFTKSWINDKHYCQSSIVLATSLKKYFSIPKEHIYKRSKRLSDNSVTSTAVYKGLQFISTTDLDSHF